MLITKDVLVAKLLQYINRKMTLAELVDWAERAICEDEFEESQATLIGDILGHIGLADVKEFGLSWDDCHEYLCRLGYKVSVEAIKFSA